MRLSDEYWIDVRLRPGDHSDRADGVRLRVWARRRG